MSAPRRPALALALALAALAAAPSAAPAQAPAQAPAAAADLGDPLTRALEDELARSMEKLRLGDQPRPYFIAYRVEDVWLTDVAATFGAVAARRTSRDRFLVAEVRVGDPAFDNSNFFSFPGRSSGLSRSFRGRLQVPLADDYLALRRQAWLLTDGAYKEALDQLARKKAALANRQRGIELPDFAAAEPATLVAPTEPSRIEPREVEELVRRLSALFRRFASIQRSEVHLQAAFVETRYVNSAGASFVRGQPLVRLSCWAERQADDGRPLVDALAFYVRDLADLPPPDELERRIAALGARLERAGDGALIERYNGPVLLEGPAAAEFALQALAPRLVGFRRPVAEDPRLEQSLEQLGGGFNDKLGGRVLARFMRLVDDPTRQAFGGEPLVGGFPIDDDAVPASPTVLVERGILKTLLTSRNPSPGVPTSTGSRRGAGAAPSNLVFSADQKMDRSGLERELLALVAERELEYGVVIRRIANPELAAGRRPERQRRGGGPAAEVSGVAEAYRLYPDGRTEPLRNLEIVGLGNSSFKDIIAASDATTVYSAPLAVGDPVARLTGAIDVWPRAVSVVVPSLLFEELTLKTPDDPVPNPPLVPHPYFDDAAP